MSKSYTPWDRFYQKLNMIFNGIVASSMIPFAIVFLQYQNGSRLPIISGELEDPIKIVLIILSLGLLITSNFLGPKLLSVARAESSIDKKLRTYLIQKIKHYAIIEGAALIALIGFFLLNQQFFSFVYVGVLFVFSMHRPTFSKVSKEINESEEDLINWSDKSTTDN